VRISVFGSLNYDITLWIARLPAPDETLPVDRLQEFCGGKGANQATAAARLGAEVAMIGCVGRDAHGDTLVRALERNGVDHRHVARVDEPTGTAFPLVAPDNVSILIARGANGVTGADHADAARAAISASDVLLIQGEVGGEGAGRAAQLAAAGDTAVVFNPAPVDDDVIRHVMPHVSIVVMNEQEQATVTVPEGIETVVTLGSRGAMVGDVHVAAFDVAVIDPTGAGDAFCAALAVAVAEGADVVNATRFASAAGACAVQVAGAEPSMPTRTQVEALLRAGL